MNWTDIQRPRDKSRKIFTKPLMLSATGRAGITKLKRYDCIHIGFETQQSKKHSLSRNMYLGIFYKSPIGILGIFFIISDPR